MTFTYNLATPNDITRVRYNIRDTDGSVAMFSDEEIQFRINETGGWQKAVIDLLQGKIMELANTPDFSAAWLRVSLGDAKKSLEQLLAMKRQEFGIALIVGQSIYAYRPDSDQTGPPTFDHVEGSTH